MHYKLVVGKETQMLQRTLVQNNDNKRSVQDWRNEFKISKLCSAYCNAFMDMLAKFQSTSDNHLARTSEAKHCMEFLNDNTQPVHLAPYRAGPKIREFEKKLY